MASTIGRLRRRVLTPNMSETKLSVRGFTEKNPESRDLLETVGGTFLTGFAHAAEGSTVAEIEQNLAGIPYEFRGFSYEGAGMALAVRDGLPFGHRHHITDFLACGARKHIYMVYVGVGWALARVPKFCWDAATSGAGDDLLRWLVHDGYGFHQAYFHTDKYVHNQYRETAFAWPAEGPRQYASRAIDQGVGRAMWFVAGTDPRLLAKMIDRFEPERHGDLYAGAGLAATYAGGGDEKELRLLVDLADLHRGELAQGAAFAASARAVAGLITPHTELATRVIAGVTPGEADDICQRVRPVGPEGDLPAYEIWRQRIRAELASTGGTKR